jgi:hypothetical protein
VSNSYNDNYSLLSSSYYLHNEFSQSLFLKVRISVGYQTYYIRTGHQSRLRVFKGVKADSLFLEYFLSKQNVKHPYLISLEFRSSLPILPMPSMGFSSSRNNNNKQMMLEQEGSMLCHNNPVDSESVFESRVSDSHLPLTISPEQCSFWFLPVLPMGSCCVGFSTFRPAATQH